MITYAKSYWGLHLLLRLYGSAIPRTLPFAILSSAFTALLTYIPYRDYFSGLFLHPYPYQLFAFIVGFSLVFRTNYGYQRYMEGRTHLQAMSGGLADMVGRALTFEAASLAAACDAGEDSPARSPSQQQQPQPQPPQQDPQLASPPPPAEVLNSYGSSNGPLGAAGAQAGGGGSLHATPPRQRRMRPSLEQQHEAAAAMRETAAVGQPVTAGDPARFDVEAGAPAGAAPPPDDPPLRSDYSWREALSEYWQQQDEQEAGCYPPLAKELPRATAVQAAHVRQYLHFKAELLHLASLFHALALQYLRVDWRLDNLQEFSPDAPPPPMDGRGLQGYKMAWKDVFILRGFPSAREAYNRASKLPVIGIISRARRTLLRQYSEADPKAITETFFSGLDRESSSSSLRGRSLFRLSFLEHRTGSMIVGGTERVYTAYTWVQLLLAARAREGGQGWKLPAPITASAFTLLSQCFASFEQCRKLADTPFPFPWSQTIVVFLIIYSLTVPIMMAAYVSQVWLGVLLTFISVLTYFSLNEIARDLEDPYIYDPNDLPLARMQYDFNIRCIAAAEAILDSMKHGGP